MDTIPIVRVTLDRLLPKDGDFNIRPNKIWALCDEAEMKSSPSAMWPFPGDDARRAARRAAEGAERLAAEFDDKFGPMDPPNILSPDAMLGGLKRFNYGDGIARAREDLAVAEAVKAAVIHAAETIPPYGQLGEVHTIVGLDAAGKDMGVRVDYRVGFEGPLAAFDAAVEALRHGLGTRAIDIAQVVTLPASADTSKATKLKSGRTKEIMDALRPDASSPDLDHVLDRVLASRPAPVIGVDLAKPHNYGWTPGDMAFFDDLPKAAPEPAPVPAPKTSRRAMPAISGLGIGVDENLRLGGSFGAYPEVA